MLTESAHMKNKNILIVDSFDFFISLPYKVAKDCGLNTISLSPKPEKGYEYIDRHYRCEHWNNSDEMLKTAMEIDRNHKIDALITFDEGSIQITAEIAEGLGLQGNTVEAANNSRNKYLMRKAFEKNQVPSPKFKLARTRADLTDIPFDFPLIVKPISGMSCMGVVRVDNHEELRLNFDKVQQISQTFPGQVSEDSYSDAVLIEEYIDGKGICIEALTYKGNTHIVIIQDKPFITNEQSPYFNENAFITPSSFSAEVQGNIVRIAKEAVASLGITSGPSHIEMMINNDGEPFVIEIGSRVGGKGLFHNAVYFSTGINYIKEIYKAKLGIQPDLESAGPFVVGNLLLGANASRAGTISNISGLDEIENLEEVKFLTMIRTTGDQVRPLPDGRDLCGSVFVQTNDYSKAISLLERINGLFQVELAQ